MTLEEIARLAGVSRSTVSRVINDEPNVSAITRERVWQVIKAHKFHPNSAARTRAGRRSQVIRLVVPPRFTTSFETGGNGARRIVLPIELVVRVSCGHMLRFTAGAQTPTRHHW